MVVLVMALTETRSAYVPRTILALGLTMKCATMRVVFVQRERIARIAVRAIGTDAYQKQKYPNQRPWTSARIGRRSNYQRRVQRRLQLRRFQRRLHLRPAA